MDQAQREVAEAREMLMMDAQSNRDAADIAQQQKNKEALNGLEASLHFLRSAKPDERSELTRRYAITITDFEKVVAYFKVYVTGDA